MGSPTKRSTFSRELSALNPDSPFVSDTEYISDLAVLIQSDIKSKGGGGKELVDIGLKQTKNTQLKIINNSETKKKCPQNGNFRTILPRFHDKNGIFFKNLWYPLRLEPSSSPNFRLGLGSARPKVKQARLGSARPPPRLGSDRLEPRAEPSRAEPRAQILISTVYVYTIGKVMIQCASDEYLLLRTYSVRTCTH